MVKQKGAIDENLVDSSVFEHNEPVGDELLQVYAIRGFREHFGELVISYRFSDPGGNIVGDALQVKIDDVLGN